MVFYWAAAPLVEAGAAEASTGLKIAGYSPLFAGVIGARKTSTPEVYYVEFKNDPQVYWFAGADLRKWVQCDTAEGSKGTKRKEGGAQAPAAKAAKTPASVAKPPTAAKSGAKPPASPAKAAGLAGQPPSGGLKALPPKPHAGAGAGSSKAPDKDELLDELQDLAENLSVSRLQVLIQQAKNFTPQ